VFGLEALKLVVEFARGQPHAHGDNCPSTGSYRYPCPYPDTDDRPAADGRPDALTHR